MPIIAQGTNIAWNNVCIAACPASSAGQGEGLISQFTDIVALLQFNCLSVQILENRITPNDFVVVKNILNTSHFE